MSFNGSMFTAITALSAFGDSMAVVGHNLANLNTAGYKASRTGFADLLPTISGEFETGRGVRLASVDRPFQQGALETTSNVTDLAINGAGFFVVRDNRGGTFYTRAGEFHLDRNNTLVNPLGFALQGTSGNISITALTLPAQATTRINLAFNLDSSSTTPAAAFPAGLDASPSAWISASNFSSLATIYDSLGNTHDLTFLFRKNGPNLWEYRVVAPRSEVDAAAPGSSELRQVSAGTLVFNSNGTLNSALSTVTGITGLSWVNGAAGQTISAGNLRFANTVQYGQPSSLFSFAQDGRSDGALTGVIIDRQGAIIGQYSNGTTQPLGNIVLANFANADDLDPLGDTLFVPTPRSGAAQVGQPGQGGRGSIVSGALELSTVDLAREFVTMITSQRAFQMNSRVITVADQMYAQAANLKT